MYIVATSLQFKKNILFKKIQNLLKHTCTCIYLKKITAFHWVVIAPGPFMYIGLGHLERRRATYVRDIYSLI